MSARTVRLKFFFLHILGFFKQRNCFYNLLCPPLGLSFANFTLLDLLRVIFKSSHLTSKIKLCPSSLHLPLSVFNQSTSCLSACLSLYLVLLYNSLFLFSDLLSYVITFFTPFGYGWFLAHISKCYERG